MAARIFFLVKRAVEMSVFVVRAFVRLREKIAANQAILERLVAIDKTLLEHDNAWASSGTSSNRICNRCRTRRTGDSVFARATNDRIDLPTFGLIFSRRFSIVGHSFHPPEKYHDETRRSGSAADRCLLEGGGMVGATPRSSQLAYRPLSVKRFSDFLLGTRNPCAILARSNPSNLNFHSTPS
jgi:hypothetical protein